MVCSAWTIADADDDRVDGQVRPRRVAAMPGDVDRELVGRRHDRAGPDGELADRQARHVVHAVDLLDAEALDQPVLDHRLAAAAAFLGRLEDDHRRAVEIPRLGEIARRAEEHRGVAVMAAGMHPPVDRRGVGLAGRLAQRQRVHVGAQADHPCRSPTFRRGSRRRRRSGRSRSPLRRRRRRGAVSATIAAVRCTS